MCYSRRSSLLAFSIVIANASWLCRGSRFRQWIALFSVAFAFVQLVEAKIWHALERDNVDANRRASAFLEPLLWLQPLAQCIGALWYSTDRFPALLIVGAMASFYKFCRAWTVPPSGVTRIGKHSHLVWPRTLGQKDFLLYLSGMFVPLIVHLPRTAGLLWYSVLSLLWSWSQYVMSGEFASMWCMIAVSYPFLGM